MEFASCEDSSAILKLSCINRPFRRIALSNPRLWSRVNLTALQPDAVQLHLLRSRNRKLDISLTYLTDVSVDRELDVWRTLLGNHSQRVVSLAISAPGQLSLALASGMIRLCRLSSLGRVELQIDHGSGTPNPPKRVLLWDAFDMSLNSIELSGSLTKTLEETLSPLQQLEKPNGERAKDLDCDSAMRVADEQEATADLLAGSLQRLEVTSTSQAALPDVDMDDQTPRQRAKRPPPGTPGKTELKEPQPSGLSSASTAVERSGSTCVKVTGFSQTTPSSSKSPCPTEAACDAMETESTATQPVGTMPDGSILVSSDACKGPRRWEDLSSEDSDDPMMVSEYLSEIYDYLRKLELRTAAKYLTLIHCFRDQLLRIPPSLLAASAYWLARIALQKFEWEVFRQRIISIILGTERTN
ncbi:hypothetical protein FRC00_006028 [Tulasnella sp. 408]|nr:hypothetical protein FRC00_006028 [Tulasnella sp. 408]